MLNALSAEKDEMKWARRYIFMEDPVAGAISPEDAARLCRNALECGQEQARRLKKTYGGASPEQICSACGVEIRRDLEDRGGGPVRFAEYVIPGAVRINGECVERAQDILHEPDMSERYGRVPVFDVLLAHELYHDIEHRKPDIFTSSYRHKKGRAALFGPARLISLSEIGAEAFVREFFALEYSACLYDLVFTYCFSREASYRLFEKMQRRLSELEGGAANDR